MQHKKNATRAVLLVLAVQVDGLIPGLVPEIAAVDSIPCPPKP